MIYADGSGRTTNLAAQAQGDGPELVRLHGRITTLNESTSKTRDRIERFLNRATGRPERPPASEGGKQVRPVPSGMLATIEESVDSLGAETSLLSQLADELDRIA
jgi:hypothetical protein